LLHFGESSGKPGFTSGKPGYTSSSLGFGVKANHESRSLRPVAARIGLRARGTLVRHLSSPWTGTDLVRFYKLDSNTLTITTAPAKNAFDGEEGQFILVWEKVTVEKPEYLK